MDRKQGRLYSHAWFAVMILTAGYFIDTAHTKASTELPILQDVTSASSKRLAQKTKEYNEALASGDSLKIAEQGYQLGKAYMVVGDHLAAQKYFMQALRIWEPRKGWKV